MLKNRFLPLIGCFFLSIGVVVMLYFLSENRSSFLNGFVRKLPPHKITGIRYVDLKYQSWYMAGVYSGNSYLGNYSYPFGLFKVDIAKSNFSFRRIKGFDTLTLFKGTYFRIDRFNIYLYDGIKPIILTGNTNEFKLTTLQKSPRFTASLGVGPSDFILRVINKKRQNVLLKLKNGKISNHYDFEKFEDGVFANDGMLIKNPDNSSFLYVFYYRNQFVSLDSNLHVRYVGKTIDTVNHPVIKVAKIRSDNSMTMTSPPKFVNEHCAANDKWLFIHSALKADNEPLKIFNNSSVLDIYSLKDGKYSFSIHLANLKGQKLRDFQVYGDTLVALYNNCFYSYKLNFNK